MKQVVQPDRSGLPEAPLLGSRPPATRLRRRRPGAPGPVVRGAAPEDSHLTARALAQLMI